MSALIQFNENKKLYEDKLDTKFKYLVDYLREHEGYSEIMAKNLVMYGIHYRVWLKDKDGEESTLIDGIPHEDCIISSYTENVYYIGKDYHPDDIEIEVHKVGDQTNGV